MLALAVIACVEHQCNLTSPIARTPKKIVLMPRNGPWQPKLGTKEIDRPSFTIVLAEDSSPLFIFGRQAVINMSDRRDHLFPAKLISENLRQGRRRRFLGSGQLKTNGSNIRDEFGRGQNRYSQWCK